MKRTTLTIIFLFLTKAIFADGIISNIDEYLEQYPKRISADGWVTIPADMLTNNKADFSRECEYRVYANEHRWLTNGYVAADIAHFVYPHCPYNPVYLTVKKNNKISLITEKEQVYKITKLEERCPAYLEYIKKRDQEKYFGAIKDLRINITRNHNDLGIQITKLTEAVITINERMNNYQKNANKSRCDNCTIL